MRISNVAQEVQDVQDEESKIHTSIDTSENFDREELRDHVISRSQL